MPKPVIIVWYSTNTVDSVIYESGARHFVVVVDNIHSKYFLIKLSTPGSPRNR